MQKIIPVLLLALLMLVFPGVTLSGAREGLLLWYQNVLPAQFPFMVCILFAMKNGLGQGGASGPAVFLSGMLAGYPGGAKMVEVLYRQGRISASRLQWLMSFCNNSGPLFVVGTVGVGMFNSAVIGYKILIAHLLAALGCAVIFGRKNRGEIFPIIIEEKRQRRAMGAVLGECVSEAASVMVTVGGFMMLYCVLIRLGTYLWPGGEYFYGLLEMTNGVALIKELPLEWAVPLAGALVSMGGFAVYSQTCAVLQNTSFSGGRYLLAKCVQGALCGLLLWLIKDF
ncbi:MAG: hypothetical protein IJ315_01935 [Firmicutes bacterium]|nr:hypothetical protein [Bacillota bacterium]